jgi:ribosome-binding factor A
VRAHRKEKIGSVIQQVVGETIVHRMHDPRIAPFTTVTRVDVTGDLAIARVFLSVQGDDAAQRRTLAALRHARGFLQREVARELSIRQCPELRFDFDRGAKEARRTIELLEDNRRRQPELYESGEDEKGTALPGPPQTGPTQTSPAASNGAGE